MSNYLELNGVSKKYSGFTLKDINFTLPMGYIMGLIGPNGAGKTTTVQLILNMIKRDEGEISVLGMDNIKNESLIKENVGVVFDSVFYADNWTVKDTGKAISIFYKNWNHNIFKENVIRFNLPWDKKVSELSRGMQMKLMIACAFSHDAKLLILDEPTSGLDSLSRDELLEILQDYIKDGKRSVLFSTHITNDLEKIADYITFINQGEVFYTGSLEELLEGYRVIKGRPSDLTLSLEKEIIGLRKTNMGFEGLINTKDTDKYKNYVIDKATVDEIIVYVSKEGVR